MLRTCQRCEHNWNYKGSAEWYTSCPVCKTSVKIFDSVKNKAVG